MGKHNTLKKNRFSKRLFLSRSNKRSSTNKRSRSKRSRTNKRSRSNRRSRSNKRLFRGGQGERVDNQYPAVYGIENKAVLYPVSKYGVPAGLFDPPILSNGPFGNGPVGSDAVSGESMSGPGTYIGGRLKQRSNTYKRGGGSPQTLMPQAVVDFSRSLTSGATKIINGFGGYTNSDSLNYKPYEQPIDKDTTYLRTNFPNVAKNYQHANKLVSGL